jgi:hypothetical protein
MTRSQVRLMVDELAEDVRQYVFHALVFVVDHGQEREAARTPFLPSDVFLLQLV